jgi:hypothetical protein
MKAHHWSELSDLSDEGRQDGGGGDDVGGRVRLLVEEMEREGLVVEYSGVCRKVLVGFVC